AGDAEVTLTGDQGTAACTAVASVVTCHEALANVGTLPISMRVVEQTAAADYAGPATDRTTVASVFGSDPIGFVDFDLTRAAPDDHGGGNDGAR
ncbi:MAG TPA: hypothetical protein VHE35_20500, partial [Kofleriaceae bacterium]|nr:hypothetical protein [Kofleriaceae bacterium]